jgi:hypothetical protein
VGAGGVIGAKPYLPLITHYDAAKTMPRPPIIPYIKKDRPADECPAHPSKAGGLPKLNQYLEDSLIEYGLCKACRVSRDHKAEACGGRSSR